MVLNNSPSNNATFALTELCSHMVVALIATETFLLEYTRDVSKRKRERSSIYFYVGLRAYSRTNRISGKHARMNGSLSRNSR